MGYPLFIICHHSGGSDANPLQDSSNFTFKDCEELHKKRFNFKSSLGFWTGYQYFIEKDGKLYQARKDTETGAHTIGYNNSSIGICMAGNFDVSLPTNAQINALRALLQKKTKEWNIPYTSIHPHRWAANKTCYGRSLHDTWAMELAMENPDEISKLQALLEYLKQKLKELKELFALKG